MSIASSHSTINPAFFAALISLSRLSVFSNLISAPPMYVDSVFSFLFITQCFMFPGIGPGRFNKNKGRVACFHFCNTANQLPGLFAAFVPPVGFEPTPRLGLDFESSAATITPRGYFFVAPPRFERGLPEPKSGVLPLHHGAINIIQQVPTQTCNN